MVSLQVAFAADILCQDLIPRCQAAEGLTICWYGAVDPRWIRVHRPDVGMHTGSAV